MFLVQIPNKKTGRVFLQISESYRDEAGKPRQRVVMPLGHLDELQAEFPDPVAHFKAVAVQMTEDRKKAMQDRVVRLDPSSRLGRAETLAPGDVRRKNIGYAALSVLYHQLEIDYLLNNRRRYTRFGANLNSIFKMLVFNRALYPDSKLGAWQGRGRFLEDAEYSLDEVYRSLDHFLAWRDDLLVHLNTQVAKRYGRDELLMYYDVTNYYFEIDEPDELRRKGVSKENRSSPIVQMGLFMDEAGLPVTYDLFRGNANDCTTLPEMLDGTVASLGPRNMIVVADKGMMSGNNISKIRLAHNGYVISYSVRGADRAFKEYVLRDEETDPERERYHAVHDENGRLVFKHKSRLTPRQIIVTDEQGNQKKTVVNERQVVIYSEKYAQRARCDRQAAIDKAQKQVLSMSRDAKASNYGSAKYILKVPVNKKTGECDTKADYVCFLDEERIDEDQKLDGYYVVCTNVIGLGENEKPFRGRHRYTVDGYFQLNRVVTDQDILDMYKGLWRIEETFKVTKSELKARPVFLSTRTHIRAHFLICFVTLLLMRLLEYRMDWKHSAGAIQESLAAASGTRVADNLYVFDHYDQVLADIGKNLGLDFSRQTLTAGEIRHMMAFAKQSS